MDSLPNSCMLLSDYLSKFPSTNNRNIGLTPYPGHQNSSNNNARPSASNFLQPLQQQYVIPSHSEASSSTFNVNLSFFNFSQQQSQQQQQPPEICAPISGTPIQQQNLNMGNHHQFNQKLPSINPPHLHQQQHQALQQQQQQQQVQKHNFNQSSPAAHIHIQAPKNFQNQPLIPSHQPQMNPDLSAYSSFNIASLYKQSAPTFFSFNNNNSHPAAAAAAPSSASNSSSINSTPSACYQIELNSADFYNPFLSDLSSPPETEVTFHPEESSKPTTPFIKEQEEDEDLDDQDDSDRDHTLRIKRAHHQRSSEETSSEEDEDDNNNSNNYYGAYQPSKKLINNPVHKKILVNNRPYKVELEEELDDDEDETEDRSYSRGHSSSASSSSDDEYDGLTSSTSSSSFSSADRINGSSGLHPYNHHHHHNHSHSHHSDHLSQKVNETFAEGKRCANCGLKDTPIWRRDTAKRLLCNACGLYFKANQRDRPIALCNQPPKAKRRYTKTAVPGLAPISKSKKRRSCILCGTKDSAVWKRDQDGRVYCSPCGGNHPQIRRMKKKIESENE